MIKQTVLGQTGLRVGRLGLGTWELGDQKIDVSTTQQILRDMLAAGGNLIDTSDNYDGAEELLGQALQDFRRDDFIVVTKCGDYTPRTFDPKTGLSTNHPKYQYAHLNFTPLVIARNIEESLKRLRVDVLDVCILHTPFLPALLRGDCIDALIRAKEQGKVRFIGYSGDNEEVVFCSQIPEFSVIELSLSIADMRNAGVPLKTAIDNNMGILVKRPIANAFWRKDLYLTAHAYAGDYRNRARLMRLKPDQHGYNRDNHGWMQMALDFVLSFPVHTIIPGTTRVDHMRENIDIVSKFKPKKKMAKNLIDQFVEAQSRIKKYSKGRLWLGLE